MCGIATSPQKTAVQSHQLGEEAVKREGRVQAAIHLGCTRVGCEGCESVGSIAEPSAKGRGCQV